jgi:hypothetical protein
MEEAGHELPAQDGRTLHHYSPVVARLDLIADRVMAVRTAVQANYTKEHQEPTFEPIERPETALDRERERRARNLLLEVDALVMGEGVEIVFME